MKWVTVVTVMVVGVMCFFGAWHVWNSQLKVQRHFTHTHGTIVSCEKGEKSTGRGVLLNTTKRIFLWTIEYEVPGLPEPVRFTVSEDFLEADKQVVGAIVPVRYHTDNPGEASVYDPSGWLKAFWILIGLGVAALFLSFFALVRFKGPRLILSTFL